MNIIFLIIACALMSFEKMLTFTDDSVYGVKIWNDIHDHISCKLPVVEKFDFVYQLQILANNRKKGHSKNVRIYAN